jgi:hypothetical protein
MDFQNLKKSPEGTNEASVFNRDHAVKMLVVDLKSLDLLHSEFKKREQGGDKA